MSNESISSSGVPLSTVLHVRDHCLCLHAQRAARAVARRFDAALAPLGLKSGQFSLLISLNRPAPPTLGSVARLLAMDRTTLTANLKPLQRRGLLTIEPDSKDRRARRLVLTEAGRALVAKAAPVWERTHQDIEAGFARDADRLRADLTALTASLEGGGAPSRRA